MSFFSGRYGGGRSALRHQSLQRCAVVGQTTAAFRTQPSIMGSEPNRDQRNHPYMR